MKMPTTSTTLLMIWAMAYWSARSNPLLTRNRLKRKRFVLEEIQKTAIRRPIRRKIWTRLSETAEKTPDDIALQYSGNHEPSRKKNDKGNYSQKRDVMAPDLK